MLSPLWAVVLFLASLLFLFYELDFLPTHLPTPRSNNLPSESRPPVSNNGISDLILYSYHETPEALRNLNFFLKHAMHSKADFLFIMNGEYEASMPDLPNVRVIDRPNRCYDLGAYGEVLNANNAELVKQYKRFIMINASLRGPFFPSWAHNCWSDTYLAPISSRTKLVGMTHNCAYNQGYRPHLQSMILATDRTGIEIILPKLKCFETMHDAVFEGETQISNWVKEAGYDVFAMMKEFEAFGGSGQFENLCQGSDVLYSGNYNGTSLHPYDAM
jgi:hypothetical protein